MRFPYSPLTQVLGCSPAALARAVRPLAAPVLAASRAGERVLVGQAGESPQLYELASVTKAFTAALAGALVRAGALEWATPLSQLGGPFRSLPAFVTVYALCTHTAGLPTHPFRTGLTAVLDYYAPYRSLDQAAAVRSAQRWAARPGRLVYSNLGAGLLGCALAYVAGEPYAAALRRWVTGPLGLDSVTVAASAPGATNFGVLTGAGGLWASPLDLLRFGEAHLQGTLGWDWGQVVTPPGRPAHIDEVAPGWFVSGGVWWHDGVARRSRAGLGFCPHSGAVFCVLARSGGPGNAVYAALQAALRPER
ncbi:serine hydrolase domain-containing protein [Deinococcus lacus]|uniref:Serine hydrolase domain-containing protein n=1 Tax=Deinococcus lacus TaxID=392561 RepID=A0ABW1YEC9_9DEIO